MGSSKTACIHEYGDNLYLISLPVPIRGFDGFIGAWVYAGDPMLLVDVGPQVSATHLLTAISELGLGAPELILLTHIHIDHAGGIGSVAAAFPRAKIVCHPKGVPHLIDPARLWQGSVKTLGDVALAYEPIVPVAVDRVSGAGPRCYPQIECIETPGHASHHFSYKVGELLFAGEAGGVCLPMPDHSIYLRPATPPRFFLKTSLESIDRLIAEAPKRICYGHIGQRDDALEMLKAHRRQLHHWLEIIRPFYQGVEKSGAMQSCVASLLAEDPLLKGFSSLPTDVRRRELNFLHNSIKGYWGYLKSGAKA